MKAVINNADEATRKIVRQGSIGDYIILGKSKELFQPFTDILKTIMSLEITDLNVARSYSLLDTGFTLFLYDMEHIEARLQETPEKKADTKKREVSCEQLTKEEIDQIVCLTLGGNLEHLTYFYNICSIITTSFGENIAPIMMSNSIFIMSNSIELIKKTYRDAKRFNILDVNTHPFRLYTEDKHLIEVYKEMLDSTFLIDETAMEETKEDEFEL